MPSPPIWTASGLLDYFQEVDATDDRRFAFVLGAGASVQSGIPMAGQLVDNWLRELHAREDHARLPLAQWATADNLRIPGFVYARATGWYPQVFARRFEHRPDEGYAYLERILHGKDPSFGYSVLAQLLAHTRHRAVVTTNFDNLVADALAIYTDQLPFVCGHESLAGFVRPNPRRPLIVKIHRDLLLAPKNRSEELAALPEPLAAVLRALLGGFTPIVLGYGGNDGSLMNFLNAMQPGEIPGGIYWCYWGRGGPPGDTTLEVVERHRGAIVPIDGFDELMAMLGHRLGFQRMDQIIEQRARERVQRYRSSFEALHQRANLPPPEAEERASEPVPGDRSTAAVEAEAEAGSDAPARSGAVREDRSPASSEPGLAASPDEPARRAPEPVPSTSPTRGPGPVLSTSPTRGPEPVSSASLTRGRPDDAASTGPTRGQPDGAGGPSGATRSGRPVEPASSDRPVLRGPRPPPSAPAAPVPSASSSPGAGPTRSDVRLSRSPAAADAVRGEPAPSDSPAPPAADDAVAFGVGREDDEPASSGSPVQQAIQALVDDAPAADDWWAYKLQADREAQPQRRVAAYQEALRRFPDQPELLLGRAAALARGGLLDQASAQYRQLAARSPDDPRVALDLAVLSALQSALPAANEHARAAWRLTRAAEREDGSMQAVVAFVRGLLARLEDRDDTTALRVLNGLLRTSELRPVGLTDLLAGLLQRLDNPSYRLYRRLLTCLLRQAPLERLQEIPRWAELTPLAPEAAWPDP